MKGQQAFKTDTQMLLSIIILFSLLAYFLGQASLSIAYNMPGINKPECLIYNQTGFLENTWCGIQSMSFVLGLSGDSGIPFLNAAIFIPLAIIGIILVARYFRGV
jgi:hypothetical protein